MTAPQAPQPSSPMLSEDYYLPIHPSIAVMIGHWEAMLLQRILFQCSRPGRRQVAGLAWYYASYPEWAEQILFLSEPTIKAAALRLERLKLVYVVSPAGRSKWYAVNQAAVDALLANERELVDSGLDVRDGRSTRDEHLDRVLAITAPTYNQAIIDAWGQAEAEQLAGRRRRRRRDLASSGAPPAPDEAPEQPADGDESAPESAAHPHEDHPGTPMKIIPGGHEDHGGTGMKIMAPPHEVHPHMIESKKPLETLSKNPDNPPTPPAGAGGVETPGGADGRPGLAQQAPGGNPPPVPRPPSQPLARPGADRAPTPLESYFVDLGIGQAHEFRDWPDAPVRAFVGRLLDSGAPLGTIVNHLRSNKAALLAAGQAAGPSAPAANAPTVDPPDWIDQAEWSRLRFTLQKNLAGSRVENGEIIGATPALTAVLRNKHGRELAPLLPSREARHGNA